MSIVDADNTGFFPAPNGTKFNDEIVISYGYYEENNQKKGAVTICEPTYSDKSSLPDERYVIGILDTYNYTLLYSLLLSNYLGKPINEANGEGKYYVSHEKFSMYSIDNVAYCGSFLAHLLKNITFKDKDGNKENNRTTLFNRLLEKPHYVNYQKKFEGEEFLLDFIFDNFEAYS